MIFILYAFYNHLVILCDSLVKSFLSEAAIFTPPIEVLKEIIIGGHAPDFQIFEVREIM